MMWVSLLRAHDLTPIISVTFIVTILLLLLLIILMS